MSFLRFWSSQFDTTIESSPHRISKNHCGSKKQNCQPSQAIFVFDHPPTREPMRLRAHNLWWNRSATLPDNERSHCATSEVQGIMVVLRRRITRQQNGRSPEQPTARYLLKRSEWLHPSFSLSRSFVHVNTCLSYPWSPYKTLRTEYETVLVLTGNPYRKVVAVD